ncbi:hypothetical protein [Leyella lascolaii]|uniref:SGNH hydrolase-type esterase domain-containing protein n=1 Tax=Leyella lascolaii TaxID=1776379 RepID=A0ABT7WZE9_9BACT|nr:hypothetical protein [Leyella lascolaii]MDN0023318.1 hypothetical protein [Leyella lascolaii]
MTRLKIFWIFILLIFIGELFLRFAFGFCDALLYRESDKYEYIAQPNQNRHRFGAHIYYNSYSQRNGEPDSTKVRVLGLGDSVIFGGTWMDQDSLASTLFSEATGTQMLNISAGSWGPDNCAAYLKEKGTFGASAMILVCSSHDAYDVMTYVPVVGVVPTYPDRQYKLAWAELIDRYLVPRIRMMFGKTEVKLDPDEQVVKNSEFKNTVRQKSSSFNNGFVQLLDISQKKNIPMAIYLHAERDEIKAGLYNEMGQKIIEWAAEYDVCLIEGLKAGETEDMYHDKIHFNEAGQRFLATQMVRLYKECLKQTVNKEEKHLR